MIYTQAKLIEDAWDPLGTAPTVRILQHFYIEYYYGQMLNYWALHGRLTSAERTSNANQRPARLALGVARGSLADARTAADVVNQLGAARRARNERRAALRIDRLSELRGFGSGKIEMFRGINVHSIHPARAPPDGSGDAVGLCTAATKASACSKSRRPDDVLAVRPAHEHPRRLRPRQMHLPMQMRPPC